MRLAVILGRVLDPKGIAVNRRVGRVFVNREEYILQPADRCALEAALRIKDESGAEVVALPRTLLPDDDVLRQALATGADRAVYLTESEQSRNPADAFVMACLLAAAVERLGGADLILLGATTLDTGEEQLGPRLAEAFGWPQLVGAWQVDVGDGTVSVVRQEAGEYVTLQADLPAVVTLQPGSLKLRYPDGVRLINVYRGVGEEAEALEQWDSVDLVESETCVPLMERRGQDFGPERERGIRVGGTVEDMIQAAAEALQKRV
jgi:electron transfer flavoprotein beta subunit